MNCDTALEDKVAPMEENLGHIESRVQDMYDSQLDLAFIEDKLVDLGERSRRNNLKVDDIKERPSDSFDNLSNILLTL